MEIKLKLKVKDVEIELTAEEARELRDVLGGLVGEKEVIVYPWYNPWSTVNPWSKPEITWTCSNTDGEKREDVTTISNDAHIYACMS